MRTPTILEGWEQFERAFAGAATPHQQRVMKLCFYAGASHLLGIAWSMGETNEKHAIAALAALGKENDDFVRAHLAGAGLKGEQLEQFMRLIRHGAAGRG